MSGTPRVRSTNGVDSEFRPVLGPKGNKAQRSVSSRKPLTKPLRKMEKSMEEEEGVMVFAEEKNGLTSSAKVVAPLTPPLRSVSRQEQLLHASLSRSASCSSDASSDSVHSRASTGRMYRSNSIAVQRRQLALKSKTSVLDGISEPLADSLQLKKRCAWVTPHTGKLFLVWFPLVMHTEYDFCACFLLILLAIVNSYYLDGYFVSMCAQNLCCFWKVDFKICVLVD